MAGGPALKVVTVEEMRRAEGVAVAQGISTDQLMERAGLAVARHVRETLGSVAGKRTLALVGPGNNGGDGLVAARLLARWGANVTVYLIRERPQDDPKLRLALREGAAILRASDDDGYRLLDEALKSSHAVIDAGLGTGRSRPLEGAMREVMARLDGRRGLLLAVDVPTGMDADTGRCDPATPTADATLALGFPKAGHFRFPGAGRVGRLEVLDIGIPPEAAQDVALEMITPEWARARLPRRPLDGHKGTFGHALIVGGSSNYPGAVCLATRAALRSGPGLVTMAAPRSLQPILAASVTEAIHLPVPDDGLGVLAPRGLPALTGSISQYDSLAVGCGMGRSDSARRFLEGLLAPGSSQTPPMVIDADGLNNLACVDRWWERLGAPAALTPHPGEMSRLTGASVADVQASRVETALEWAAGWGVVVVLKGAYTVAASPGGMARVSPFANPILATGGTGDALTGVIAGLLAQGMSPMDAACVGVYLHGAAAERLSGTYGDRGATAEDLIAALPLAAKALLDG